MLLLANSEEMENKIAAGDGRVARFFKDKKDSGAMVDELYLLALSRKPSAAERKRLVEYIEAAKDKQRATEDALWALLNTREFMFNH